MRTPHFEQKTSEFQLQKIGYVVLLMFLTSELVYALWEEVPKLVYYRLICKPVIRSNVCPESSQVFTFTLFYNNIMGLIGVLHKFRIWHVLPTYTTREPQKQVSSARQIYHIW